MERLFTMWMRVLLEQGFSMHKEHNQPAWPFHEQWKILIQVEVRKKMHKGRRG